MLRALLVATLFCTSGTKTSTIEDRFDLVEVNHMVNEYGGEVWCQLIYWDWRRQGSKYHVQFWIMMKEAYDDTDEEHRVEHEKKVEEFLRGVEATDAGRIRAALSYRGKFIGGKLYPVRTKEGYVVSWIEDSGVRRRIVAKSFRETYTAYDPERLDREEFAESRRRGLTEIWKPQLE